VGLDYHTKLPYGYVRVDSYVELLELKENRRVWKADNIQFIDETVLVYSDYSQRWYERPLAKQGHLEAEYKGFSRRGGVAIPEERKASESEIKERERVLLLEYYKNNQTKVEGVKTKIKQLSNG
jgi:hypothetical protein